MAFPAAQREMFPGGGGGESILFPLRVTASRGRGEAGRGVYLQCCARIAPGVGCSGGSLVQMGLSLRAGNAVCY